MANLKTVGYLLLMVGGIGGVYGATNAYFSSATRSTIQQVAMNEGPLVAYAAAKEMLPRVKERLRGHNAAIEGMSGFGVETALQDYIDGIVAEGLGEEAELFATNNCYRLPSISKPVVEKIECYS